MRIVRCLGLAAVLGICASANAAEFRLLIAFDKTNPATPLVGEAFAKAVETASSGRMKVRILGPETVPSFEQLQPVAAGVFDFHLTVAAYHTGTVSAGSVLDGMTADIDKLRSSGMIDEVDRRYQRIGVKIVGVPYLTEASYQIILREPVGPSGDLKGRKLRASPTYRAILDLLGASAVIMSNAETYTALEKGVVDGAAWTSVGILSAKFYEVNKHLLRPTFGSSHLLILANLNKWNGLSAEDKKAVMEAGLAAEQNWRTKAPQLAREEEEKLVKDHGMKVTRMSDALAAKLNRTWASGAWELAIKRDPSVEALRKFAREKGVAE